MSLYEAKGVHDRTFSLTTYPGDSQWDIKEVLNPQGNPHYQKRLDELLHFRKLMLFYRLIHFKDPLVDIDTGLKRRNRELCKPIMQLFYNSESSLVNEITSALEIFLGAKERKQNTIEAALFPIICRLTAAIGKEVYVKELWNSIVAGELEGHYDERKPNNYQTSDYGTLYRNSFTNIIRDKFGAAVDFVRCQIGIIQTMHINQIE